MKRIKQEGFDIKHPEMFLGLNGKIVTNAFCLFDMPYPYGISGREKEVNKREIKVNDKDVLELQMLQ